MVVVVCNSCSSERCFDVVSEQPVGEPWLQQQGSSWVGHSRDWVRNGHCLVMDKLEHSNLEVDDSLWHLGSEHKAKPQLDNRHSSGAGPRCNKREPGMVVDDADGEEAVAGGDDAVH